MLHFLLRKLMQYSYGYMFFVVRSRDKSNAADRLEIIMPGFFAMNYKKVDELSHYQQLNWITCVKCVPTSSLKTGICHLSELIFIVNMHWQLFPFLLYAYITQCLIIYLKG